MAYNSSLKVKSLFGKDEDDYTTEYQNNEFVIRQFT